MIIAGIDEAGRGPVLGPLVVAGVSIEAADEHKLKTIGVRDSKELSPSRREKLAKEIEKVAGNIFVLKVGPCKIDRMRREGTNMNEIELNKFAEIMNFLLPEKLFVDAPDVNAKRFGEELSAMADRKIEVVAEHKAENKFPVVAAASIIAKVTRDAEVEELRKKYGIRGSGYPSDPETIDWMKEYYAAHKKWPEKTVRETWDTAVQIMGGSRQSGITRWLMKKAGKTH
jgi:ribonuclease HII